jgi:hypothetical protein
MCVGEYKRNDVKSKSISLNWTNLLDQKESHEYNKYEDDYIAKLHFLQMQYS